MKLTPQPLQLAILSAAKTYLEQVDGQTETLGWDIISSLEEAKINSYQWVLSLEADVLLLRNLENKALDRIKVDFSSGAMTYRQRHGGGRGELLAKAVGVRKNNLPSVLDVTAGLGKDSFILAGLGCDVTMIERSPLVAALLQNGLARAAEDSDLLAIVQRMHFVKIDALVFLKKIQATNNSRGAPDQFFDSIYLDPMFPENKKSRLVKKEMQAFRLLVGEDLDGSDLFDMAMASGIRRVIVKRHRHAQPLGNAKPDICFPGRSSRFDVYINHAL